MANGELTYDDFLQRLDIQDILMDAGYHLNKRDGLRYPSYIRMDSNGTRIRGDKFIVTPNGKCCFQPPQQKLYNIISFIKAFPEKFAEHRNGVSPDRLVNLVCNRLLNQPINDRPLRIIQPRQENTPFRLDDYDIHRFDVKDRETHKRFLSLFQEPWHRHLYTTGFCRPFLSGYQTPFRRFGVCQPCLSTGTSQRAGQDCRTGGTRPSQDGR